MPMAKNLFAKYDIAGPRYTSYPTVPYWQGEMTQETWLGLLHNELVAMERRQAGVSLYIHIPFCEQLCTFCGCNKRITKKHQMAKPYIEAVLAEWQLYRSTLDFESLPLAEMHLGGGTPTFLTAREFETLLVPILDNLDLMPEASLSFEADPRVTNQSQMQSLYDLGFRRLSFGVQDFAPKVQKVINRVQSVEQVYRLTEAAREIGYKSVNYDLIYGLPLQTLTSMAKTLDIVLEHRPDRIAFYAYAHVPWVSPGQRHYTKHDLPQGPEKRALYEMGRELFLSEGYVEIGFDHFALPNEKLAIAEQEGRLFRNFMGYIDQHASPMIGLGCSAISDAWGGFAQNLKEVEAYQKQISSGQLAVFKGHQLTAEDKVLRQHILNLMTKLQTSWQEKKMFTDHLLTVPDLLKPFLADGLMDYHNYQLTVHEAGRPFLRNICMCFDARLWRCKPEQKIFSQTV